MFIERLSALKVACVMLLVVSQQVPAWEDDWDLDTSLNALDEVKYRPVILPHGDRGFGRQRGAPSWPYYKQQPPGAQGDFRDLPRNGSGRPATVTGGPGAGPTSTAVAGGAPGQAESGNTVPGPSAPANGGAGNGGVQNPPPQGPQLPPPEVEVPDVPLPNLPPLPPLNPPSGGLI